VIRVTAGERERPAPLGGRNDASDRVTSGKPVKVSQPMILSRRTRRRDRANGRVEDRQDRLRRYRDCRHRVACDAIVPRALPSHAYEVPGQALTKQAVRQSRGKVWLSVKRGMVVAPTQRKRPSPRRGRRFGDQVSRAAAIRLD